MLLAGGHVIRVMAANPDDLPESVMAGVGKAAASGQAPPKETMDKVYQLATERPLNWEPFIVHGAIALRDGDLPRAERLIVFARDRAPRAPAARYLLADAYLQSGRPLEAMKEMAVLNRLLPAASAQLAPALADYARAPGAVAKIRTILASYPELETPLLATLSNDPANTDLILALASAKHSAGPAPDWQRLLLTTLVNAGQFEKAYAIWRRFAGAPDLRGGFYNPTFTDQSAPPPFNWQFARGAGGVAEPGKDGLQVLYFGRDNADLANQVLLLPAGDYRLSMSVVGSISEAAGISWTGTCVQGQRPILALPIQQAGVLSKNFSVPEGCEAQRITLQADAPDVPQSADFQIVRLQLTRVRS